MSHQDEYEAERTASPVEAAAVLSAVADGLVTGSVRLGEGEEAVAVAVPEELDLEVEFEREDGESSLEVELTWPDPEGEDAVTPVAEAEKSGIGVEPDEAEETGPATEEVPVPVGATDATESLARFEVYRDRGDEWRWRLRHRNGNVIATSGEGYRRKRNAWKGLESVMANAPDAAVRENVE